jgi:hypothetical protein
VTPFQTPYFSENLVGSGIDPGTSGSVARNSDHWTTEAVASFLYSLLKCSYRKGGPQYYRRSKSINTALLVGFEVLTVLTMKKTVLWAVVQRHPDVSDKLIVLVFRLEK